ncbi:MAG: hypothetical protein II126_05505 [Erysipelotrichaceae bacterium]|nr:hypothetical protein [Erysipelotrichaceae bacterium]
MKKMLIVLATLMVLMASGCGNRYEETVSEDQIMIVVDIKAEDVHLMVFAYSLDGEPMGVIESGYVDGSALSGKMYIELEKPNFPEEASLKNFSFHLGLSDNVNDSVLSEEHQGRNGATDACDPFEIEYGKIYHFELTGSYENGFILTRID